jgi:mutator protein MutT
MKDELVCIVDEKDNLISTATGKEMRQKNLLHRCTYVLVFNSKGEIFITKRTKTKDVAPGLYEIGQGGVVNPGETYEQSAKRELFEELGIKAELAYLFDFRFKGEKSKFLAKVFTCKYDGKMTLQETEIEHGSFFSLEKLKEMFEKNPEQFTKDGVMMIRKYFEYAHK